MRNSLIESSRRLDLRWAAPFAFSGSRHFQAAVTPTLAASVALQRYGRTLNGGSIKLTDVAPSGNDKADT